MKFIIQRKNYQLLLILLLYMMRSTVFKLIRVAGSTETTLTGTEVGREEVV